MEQPRFLACVSDDSRSSSGSHTLSEGEEEVTSVLHGKVSGDGDDDGHSSDFESVNEAEDDMNAEYEKKKKTAGDEESEEDEDEKVNTPIDLLKKSTCGNYKTHF